MYKLCLHGYSLLHDHVPQGISQGVVLIVKDKGQTGCVPCVLGTSHLNLKKYIPLEQYIGKKVPLQQSLVI